jgi:hypothetical protein
LPAPYSYHPQTRGGGPTPAPAPASLRKGFMTKVCLAITANHDKVDRDFMMHLVTLERPSDTMVSLRGSHIKAVSLNEHVAEAANNGCSHVFFMDVDMNFPPWTLYKLMSHKLPIVTGLYHLKSTPYSPIMGWISSSGVAVNGRGRQWKEDYYPLPKDALVQIDWCGIGCLLVDMDVFNKIWYPPFRDEWDMELGNRRKGHDVIFCEEARKAGYKIFADTSVDVMHIGRAIVSRAWAETYHRCGMDAELLKTVNAYSMEPAWWNEKWMKSLVKRLECPYRSLIKALMALIPPKSSVIDLGCGDGSLLRFMKELNSCDVYGVDFSSVAIRTLAEKGVPGEVADLRAYNPNGRRAHTVILSHVLEHMTTENAGRLVKTVSDLATDQAMIVVPEESELWYEHTVKYTEDSLRRITSPHFDSVNIFKVERDEPVSVTGSTCHIVAHCRKAKAGGSDEVSPAVTG